VTKAELANLARALGRAAAELYRDRNGVEPAEDGKAGVEEDDSLLFSKDWTVLEAVGASHADDFGACRESWEVGFWGEEFAGKMYAEEQRVRRAVPDTDRRVLCSCWAVLQDVEDLRDEIVLPRICMNCWAEDHPEG
jgi:hypothetical protein